MFGQTCACSYWDFTSPGHASPSEGAITGRPQGASILCRRPAGGVGGDYPPRRTGAWSSTGCLNTGHHRRFRRAVSQSSTASLSRRQHPVGAGYPARRTALPAGACLHGYFKRTLGCWGADWERSPAGHPAAPTTSREYCDSVGSRVRKLCPAACLAQRIANRHQRSIWDWLRGPGAGLAASSHNTGR